MIMTIEFINDGRELPDTLKIYYGEDDGAPVFITFWDNGNAPDENADDRKFAAYFKEDIPAFLEEIENGRNLLAKDSGYVKFSGHTGQWIEEIPEFDFNAFDDFIPVPVDPNLIPSISIDCNQDLLKQNSLFITDLSVVENEDRTYRVTDGWGTPMGVWTFGYMIKNIANYSSTGVTAKALLKEWLKGWASGRTIYGQTVPARTDVFFFLIGPWLQAANPGNTYYNDYYRNVGNPANNINWEVDWDNTDETALLTVSPFKLTAIVNRIDLRGNSSFKSSLTNAGETRFIFTLVAPFELSGLDHPTTPIGYPPRQADGLGGCNHPLDWEGMNVILEYGNPFTNLCNLRNFANMWLSLSSLTLGNSQYLDALEDITEMIVRANAAPNKPNGSALNQIRTNERIFAKSQCAFQRGGSQMWVDSDWELSQFELDNTSHLLLPAPVTNTPNIESNMPLNLDVVGGGTTFPAGTDPYNAGTGSAALIDWMFWRKYQVNKGNHNLPINYTYSGDQMKLAATARMDAEQVHYWDINWSHSGTTHYTNIPYAQNTSYIFQKQMRQQLSLNTCQGCHGGETKTLFTMVRPVPYGESANYWGNTPNHTDGKFPVDYRKLDTRFAKTNGKSYVNGGSTPENTHAFINPSNATTDAFYPRVSPFITGRNYSGTSGTWQDDLHNSIQDPGDNEIEDPLNPNAPRLFYVYDPTDNHNGTDDNTYPGPDQVFGYNDLQRRKADLCKFVKTSCSASEIPIKTAAIIKSTLLIPLPKNGH